MQANLVCRRVVDLLAEIPDAGHNQVSKEDIMEHRIAGCDFPPYCRFSFESMTLSWGFFYRVHYSSQKEKLAVFPDI